MEEKQVKGRDEGPVRTIPKSPVERLSLLSTVMLRKAVGYGKSNVARFIFNAGQSIAVDVKAINEATVEIDKEILRMDAEIDRLVAGNRKLTEELFAIKSSRLWPIYRRLTGHAA